MVFLGLTVAMALGFRELRGRTELSWFTAAYGVVIASAALFAGRGWLPAFLTEVVANLLVVTAAALILDGTRLFSGLSRARAIGRVAVALAALGLPWLAYVRPSEAARTILTNGLVAGRSRSRPGRPPATAPAASDCWRSSPRRPSRARARAFGVRAAFKATGAAGIDLRDGDVTAAITTLAGTLAAVIWTMTVLTSANRRLALEVARARDEVTHLMVHDLRSPMVSITGALDLLTASKELAPKDEALVQMARRNAARQNALIDSILDIWQLEQGAFPQRRTRVSVGTLVAEALRLAQPRAQARGLTLVSDVPGDLPEAWADQGLAERVLANLVGNAIKFSPESGAA